MAFRVSQRARKASTGCALARLISGRSHNRVVCLALVSSELAGRRRRRQRRCSLLNIHTLLCARFIARANGHSRRPDSSARYVVRARALHSGRTKRTDKRAQSIVLGLDTPRLGRLGAAKSERIRAFV